MLQRALASACIQPGIEQGFRPPVATRRLVTHAAIDQQGAVPATAMLISLHSTTYLTARHPRLCSAHPAGSIMDTRICHGQWVPASIANQLDEESPSRTATLGSTVAFRARLSLEPIPAWVGTLGGRSWVCFRVRSRLINCAHFCVHRASNH